MRVYVGDLEDRVDKSLKKWKKYSRNEDRGIAQIEWQFGLARVILDIFWGKNERVKLECRCAKIHSTHEWDDLTKETADNVMDRVSNFAQIVAGRQNG